MLDIPGIEYFKAKNSWCGGLNQMRCRIAGTEELTVCIWPEPYEYSKTADELKSFKTFELSVQGIEEIKAYLSKSFASKE